MAIVTLRYWAAAKDAAGLAEEKVSAQDLSGALAAALAAAAERDAAERDASKTRAERLRLVIARSSFLIDDQPVGLRPPESVSLADGAVIEVLPPFAGG